MSSGKNKPAKSPPPPVLHAKTALDVLSREDAVLAQSVEKLLPGYAMRLEKSGEEVTPEKLLDAARQGVEFLKSSGAVQKQSAPHDTIAAYKKIVSSFPAPMDTNPISLLINASKAGDEETVRKLLSPPHNVTADVYWAQMYAIEEGHTNIFFLLLEQKEDKTKDMLIFIEHAIRHERLDILKLLIEKSMLKEIYLPQALGSASLVGNIEIFQLLMTHADKKTLNAAASSCLSYAMRKNNIELMHLLLENTPVKISSALMEGARCGYVEATELLLKHKNLSRPDMPHTFLVAASEGHNDILKLLLNHGIEPEPSLVFRSITSAAKYPDTVRFLMEWGGHTLRPKDIEEHLLLSFATSGHVDCMRLLVEEYKVNPHTPGDAVPVSKDQSSWQKTTKDMALEIAAASNTPDMIEYLISKGISVNARDNNPLITAIQQGRIGNADMLLKHGADIKAVPETDALKKYITCKEQIGRWQRIVHINPPEGLQAENPALFKKGCFDAAVKILAEESYSNDHANTMAFHAAALFQTEQRLLQYLQQWGRKSTQPLHNLIYQIKVPSDGSPNLKDWGDAVLKCGPSMAKLVKYSDRIPSPMKSSDGKTWSMLNTRAECAKFSFNRAAEHPALASLCFERNVVECDFNTALGFVHQYPPRKNIPDISIDGKNFDADGYRFYRLPADDVRGLFLGEMTDCCQSIGRAGKDCATHGYTSENGGFYVVENARGKIVAQTWAWRGQNDEMCFDSLETLGNNVSPAQWIKILQETARELSVRKDHDVKALHVGTGGATPTDYLRSAFSRSAAAAPKDYDGYRDSKGAQILVWKNG